MRRFQSYVLIWTLDWDVELLLRCAAQLSIVHSDANPTVTEDSHGPATRSSMNGKIPASGPPEHIGSVRPSLPVTKEAVLYPRECVAQNSLDEDAEKNARKSAVEWDSLPFPLREESGQQRPVKQGSRA